MLSEAILRTTNIVRQNKTVHQATALLSGKAGVHIIALISQPILARLYSPAQFGEFALLNSILAILLIGACGRYEAGIVLTRNPKQAQGLFQLGQIILIVYVLLLNFLLLFLPEFISTYLVKKGIPMYFLWLIPFMVAFSGYWQIVYNWLLRFQKFSQISFALFIQRVLIFLSAVTAAYLPFSINGLIFSLFIGFSGIFVVSLLLKRQAFTSSFKKLGLYAFQFKDFPLFSVPTLFLNLFMIHLPVLWITFFYSKENAGYYNLAYTLMSVPLQFLHASLGQIFYQRIARLKSRNESYIYLIKYCKVYLLLLIPPSLIITFFGQSLTEFLLGNNWQNAGVMLSSMALLIAIQGLSSLFMFTITVLRKQGLNLGLQVFQLLLWILAFCIGHYFEDLIISIRIMVLFSALHLIFTTNKVFNLINHSHDSHSHRSLAN